MEPIQLTTVKNDITPREQRATHLQNFIKWRRGKIKDEFIGMGIDLLEFYQSGLWTELQLDSFEQFLVTPEVNLSVSLGYDLVRIGALVATGFPAEKLAKIGISNLRLILPKLEEGEDAEKWLDLAEELTWRDLDNEVHDKDTHTYSKTGPLTILIEELHSRGEFWSGDVSLHVRTL